MREETFLLLYGLSHLNPLNACTWPAVDALFVVDSTPYVTSFQHRSQLQFFRQVLSKMKFDGDGSRVSLAQFTPSARLEYTLLNSSNIINTIEDIMYFPCELEQCPRTSVNNLAKVSLSDGNRKAVPDVIVVLSNSVYPLQEVLEKEPLISPQSPLHVFYVVIGTQVVVSRFEPSAHTVGLKVTDYASLSELVEPICESVNGYIRGWQGRPRLPSRDKIIPDLSWWNFLNWNSTACHHHNAQNTVFWTTPCGTTTRFGSLCWIIIAVTVVIAALLLLILAYAIHSFREENKRLRYRMIENERALRKQNEYFTAKLHSQMQQQIKSGEKYAEDILKQQEILQAQLERQPVFTTQPQPITVPIYLTNPANPSQNQPERPRSRSPAGRKDHNENDIEENHVTSPENDVKTGQENEGDWKSEEPSSMSDESSEPERKTHLPPKHPALSLPPIDLMFLVDTSSSIGNNNFEILKNCVCEVLKEVDIAPGRSRVALLQYAQDPSVVFGFDRFYSYESVRRGVMRLSYTGGATMLSKALAFAGGIMYKEQNMKTQHRRHKFLPTPRHDRLQVLCLVSDGYSDDNADKESVVLHEKLHVKVFAIVTRSFNKEKLVPITRFEGSVFTVQQKESIAIWLWRQQKNWAENYATYVEKEKALAASSREK
ncbi:unnamed protein product [Caenorhabditis auriculariae]|uniref:VWFA domain-containing protein n=1 Tax=Caenorhabditis auriculariae TaxID=2777116 RepID=A0A8S1GUX5_9PELO|nr:unnamed protein product [Caenorhabditis auriculariae]